MLGNLLGKAFGFLTGRVDHIPAADLDAVCEATAGYTEDGAPVRPDQWRAMEMVQTQYVLGRIVRQATPRGRV